MKHLKYISIISIMALITAPAVADIASAEYVDASLGAKLSNNATGNNLAIGSGANSISYDGAPDKNIAIGSGARAGNNGDWSEPGIALGTNARSEAGIAIGNNADGSLVSIAIGEGAKTNGDSAIAIGVSASTNDFNEIAIGYKAKVGFDAMGAIQLGQGTNNQGGTLQVYNYQLLDANGKIPAERLTNAPSGLPNGPNDGKKYSLIWNGSSFAFEEFTTGGGSTPIDWTAISAYIGDYESDPNYTFAGYGFALDPDTYDYANYCEGSAGWDVDMEDQLWFGVDEDGSDACSVDPRFAGMVAGDWYLDLPPMNVKIEGRALCSSTNGTKYQPGDPDGSGTGDTKYCWCKMTSPAASRWVFNLDYDNADNCANSCAYYCAYHVRDNSVFRSALFGSVGQ